MASSASAVAQGRLIHTSGTKGILALNPIEASFDHLIVPVASLAAASRVFEQLGFMLTPASSHPFGTANRLVLFEGSFIELLAVQEPDKLGAFQLIADFIDLTGGGGWSVIWRPADIEKAHQVTGALGLEPSTLQREMVRTVDLPGGKTGVAMYSSFALAHDLQPTYMEGFSIQHRPENVFVPEWAEHVNGARRITEIVVSSTDVATDEQRLRKMFGAVVRAEHGGFVMPSDAGDVRFLPFATGAATPHSKLISTVTIECNGLDGIRARGAAAGIVLAEQHPGSLTLMPGRALPLNLCFVAASETVPA